MIKENIALALLDTEEKRNEIMCLVRDLELMIFRRRWFTYIRGALATAEFHRQQKEYCQKQMEDAANTVLLIMSARSALPAYYDFFDLYPYSRLGAGRPKVF